MHQSVISVSNSLSGTAESCFLWHIEVLIVGKLFEIRLSDFNFCQTTLKSLKKNTTQQIGNRDSD